MIDYAHTPDALQKALAALRPVAQQRGGRLVVVFGCGGDRDPGKRPIMGDVATGGADAVFLTSDNPRGEDARAIIDQIAAAAAGARVVVDRAAAIAEAVASAGAADVVPLAQPLSAYPPLRMELRRLACISAQSDGKKPTRRLPRSKTTSWWRMLAAPMTAPLCSLSKTPRHQMPWRSSYAY